MQCVVIFRLGETTPKKNFRKRFRNPKSWKANLRKDAHQNGKSYTNRRGKFVESKVVKTVKNCSPLTCKYKCQNKISDDERTAVYESFYSLSSSTEKRHFIIATSERLITARTMRKVPKLVNLENVDDPLESNDSEDANKDLPSSRRQYSFKYFFLIKGEKIQICNTYILPINSRNITKTSLHSSQ